MSLDRAVSAIGLAIFLTLSARSQGIPESARPISGYENLFRSDNLVFVRIANSELSFPYRLPQFAAPLRSIRWLYMPDLTLQVTPETDHWSIHRANNSPLPESGIVQIEFEGQEVQLTTAAGPTKQNGDGSLWLPAHLAKTSGKKLRYEPQPNKNTLGYWVESTDTASWQFEIERPGKFNVAVLQGCGSGQGGSTAVIALSMLTESSQSSNVSPRSSEEIEFVVKETGHFQNFQWLHLSEVELVATGKYELVVRPKKIHKNALMDLRTLHLIWVP